MDKKPLIVVSLCAVVLLVLGSLSNVVGYQSVKSTVNDSPLFKIRTQRKTSQQHNIITSQYLGMGNRSILQFPMKDNRNASLKKAIETISTFDEKTFGRFTELCLQKIRQDNTRREINPNMIIRTLYMMRTQPDLFIASLMNRDNQNVISSNYDTICHWSPGCILNIIFHLAISIIIIVSAIRSCSPSCAPSICCKNNDGN